MKTHCEEKLATPKTTRQIAVATGLRASCVTEHKKEELKKDVHSLLRRKANSGKFYRT
jgi:hypothetical protein